MNPSDNALHTFASQLVTMCNEIYDHIAEHRFCIACACACKLRVKKKKRSAQYKVDSDTWCDRTPFQLLTWTERERANWKKLIAMICAFLIFIYEYIYLRQQQEQQKKISTLWLEYSSQCVDQKNSGHSLVYTHTCTRSKKNLQKSIRTMSVIYVK